MAYSFCPDNWILTEKLRDYARKKRLTEETIDDQEEAFRLCQFNRVIKCWDRAWMNWIRNALEWGKVQPTLEIRHRMPEELSADERADDQRKFDEQIRRFKEGK